MDNLRIQYAIPSSITALTEQIVPAVCFSPNSGTGFLTHTFSLGILCFHLVLAQNWRLGERDGYKTALVVSILCAFLLLTSEPHLILRGYIYIESLLEDFTKYIIYGIRGFSGRNTPVILREDVASFKVAFAAHAKSNKCK